MYANSEFSQTPEQPGLVCVVYYFIGNKVKG